MSHALILAILLQVPASVPAATSQEPASSNELRIVAEAQPAVRLTGLHAKLRVEGPIMKVEQQLVLRNPGSEAQGFDLVFPLGRAARLTGLTLTADGRALTGTLLDADEARRLYKTTLKADGDPALLEHYGEPCTVRACSRSPLRRSARSSSRTSAWWSAKATSAGCTCR